METQSSGGGKGAKCCSTLHGWKKGLASIKAMSNSSESYPGRQRKTEGAVQVNSWLVTPSDVKLEIGNIKGLDEVVASTGPEQALSARAYRLSQYLTSHDIFIN